MKHDLNKKRSVYYNRFVVAPKNEKKEFVGIIYSPDKIEYVSLGIRHRIDGPAVIYWYNNENFYYIHGKKVDKQTQEFYYDLMKLKGIDNE